MSLETRQLAKIARLYFIEELNQRTIAGKLGISMASVSRGLARARELGIVRITIEDTPDFFDELEVAIESRFPVKEVIVTPTSDAPANTYRRFAQSLADVLPRVAGRGALVGVSWGHTLRAVGEEIEGLQTMALDVVPVVGSMGTIETGIFPNTIARAFADRLGGDAYIVNAPAVLDLAATAQALMADSTFAPIRGLWDRLDVAILGASDLGATTSMARDGIFSDEELDQLRAAGAVAATNFQFLDHTGDTVEHTIAHRLVSLSRRQLERVATTIVIAGGSEKVAAIAAVLRSGFVGVLITDERTARGIVDLGAN